MSTSRKFAITKDAAGVVTGATDKGVATMIDGVIAALPFVNGDEHVEGTNRNIGLLVVDAVVIAGTSKVVSGSWLPRSAQQ